MKNSQNIQTVNNSSHVTLGNQTIEAETSPAAENEETVRVLFLAANPAGTSSLHLDQEIKAIDEALRRSRLSARFRLEQSWAVGDRELQDGLLRWQPEIVHFSGHGAPSGRLLLESSMLRDLGNAAPPSPPSTDPQVDALARVFAAARGKIRCLVLNACHTESTARAIAQSVGCVIGMSQSVADAAAIRFSWAFYNALGYGLSVKKAFELGTAQMGLADSQQADVPRLVTSGVDPAQIVFG